jgi:Tfp pilus assembly pilus retraction ATPase PilT
MDNFQIDEEIDKIIDNYVKEMKKEIKKVVFKSEKQLLKQYIESKKKKDGNIPEVEKKQTRKNPPIIPFKREQDYKYSSSCSESEKSR